MIFFINTLRSPSQDRQSIPPQSLIPKIIKLKKELKNQKKKKTTEGLRKKKNFITIRSVFSIGEHDFCR